MKGIQKKLMFNQYLYIGYRFRLRNLYSSVSIFSVKLTI
jgi:hypothetical protein